MTTNAAPQATNAAVYLRISSDPSGQQLGVSRQREDCVSLCAEKAWTPVEYVDNDISASSGKRRPAYERMLADIRDGRIGAVVAWDLDRLHRRPIELESFMALADDKHLALATVSGDVDLSTAQGRLVARLKGSVAAHEIEHKRSRQLRAAEQKAQRGEPQWRRAFGYLADTRQPDPVTAPLVVEAYRAILSGASLNDVRRLFNGAGAYGLNGQPWQVTTVSLFLRAARNAGLRSHNGEIVGKGNWPGLVPESLWRQVQAKLNAPGRKPGKKSVSKHLLTGVMLCGKPGCDGYLAGNWQPRRDVGYVLAYCCKTCRGTSIRAEHVEPLLYDLLGGRLAKKDAQDLLKAEIHDQAEAEAIRDELSDLYGELQKIGVERGKRLLTGEQAQIATELINQDIAVLERKQNDAERVRVFEGLDLGTPRVVEQIRRLSPDRFRAVLAVLGVVTVKPVGKGHRANGERFDAGRVDVDWS